jgi:hypothetical protein
LSGLPRRGAEDFEAVLAGQGHDLAHVGRPLPDSTSSSSKNASNPGGEMMT